MQSGRGKPHQAFGLGWPGSAATVRLAECGRVFGEFTGSVPVRVELLDWSLS